MTDAHTSKYFRGKGGPSQIASPAWSQAGFVWATAGTMGFVRAKASPLTSQIPDGPGRALPRPSPWSHQMTHGPFGPWLPGRPRSGLAHGSLFQATPARTNPSLAPYGLAQDQPMVICPCISRKGPMPSMCNPVQIPHIRFVPFSNLMAVYHMVYCGTLRFSSLGKYRTQDTTVSYEFGTTEALQGGSPAPRSLPNLSFFSLLPKFSLLLLPKLILRAP